MIIKSFQINDTLKITPIATEDIVPTLKDPDARIWVDLQDPEIKELSKWLDKLGVKDLAYRLCLQAHDRSGFYPLKNELFFVIPIFIKSDRGRQVEHVSILCRENLLITLHHDSFAGFETYNELNQSDSWLPQRSIAGLVSSLMIHLSLECLQKTTELRDSIIVLEERMDHAPDTVGSQEILNKRAEILALGATVSDQLPSLQALSVTDKPFFKLEDTKEYMNCALANVQAADGSMRWLDGRINALRSGYEMNAQDKTNRRLNMLTILSAIFMPITLLAGIWGMNFTVMPELKHPLSYPIALCFMGLIGWGMFKYFRKNGWLE